MVRKLVFLDIDGTLMDSGGFVPPSALTACREARRQGHLLYICSGRPRPQISDGVLAIGFDGVVSSGGAHIETGNTTGEIPYRGNIIFDAAFPVETVKQLAAYFHSRQCGFSIENNNRVLSNRRYISYWEFILNYLAAEKKDSKLVSNIMDLINNSLPEDPESYDASVYKGVNKIIFAGGSFDEVEQTFGGVCEIFRGSIPHCGSDCGEICPPGVHKGSALEITAGYHGIPLAQTIAFGDSDNDRRMIERAGTGVAMGNAVDALKVIADDITSSMEDDGLFNGFKKHGLI